MRIPRMTNKTRFVVLILGFFTGTSAVAQQVFNPYTQLGIGLPVYNPIAAASSMGGGYNALRGNKYINFLNPASYSSYEYMQFQFGFETQSVTATKMGNTRKANPTFFNQLAIGLPIWKNKIGMVLGYTPYTDIGYKFSNTGPITTHDTTVNATYTYEGKGGVDRFMLGFGGNPVKGLSIGFNTYFYLGNIDRSKTSYFPSSFGSYNIQSLSNIRIADFGFDFGAQYVINFKDNRDSVVNLRQRKDRFRLTFGGTYTLGKAMSARNTSVARYFAGDLVDQFYNQDTIAARERVKIQFPTAFGAGISFGQPDYWLITADFNMTLWSQFRYANHTAEPLYGNSYYTTLGGEITPRSKNPKRILGNLTYRIGGRYGQSMLRPGGQPFQETAVSFGLGIPILINDAYGDRVKNQKLYSSFNVGIEYGMTTPKSTLYTKEQMIRLVFSFNIRNKWFNTYKFQ